MAKKIDKSAVPKSIDVRYDLRDLQSAQHKAGLAGLILQIENMRERRDAGQLPSDSEIPEVVERTASSAVIQFTERSAQNLFDDLYAAETVEILSKTKWQGATEKRQQPNTIPGPNEPKRWFVYDSVQPTGHFLRNFTEGDKEPWHRLWREMIYAVPRNKPTTRQAFKSRAEKQPTREGSEAWKALVSGEKAKANGTQALTELAGSLMLAVQAVTAEAVPFEDRVERQLLLHFWILTARVFVPQRVDADGNSEFVGYALAIPEVGNLDKFCKRYKELLAKLDAKKNRHRPAQAVVALPEQGPLEFLYNLDRLVVDRVLAERPASYVAGIEYFHMVVAGNNVKLKAHGRVPVEDGLIENYAEIRRDFHNSELIAGLILALLRNRPWFTELDRPIHEREWSQLVHSTQERHRSPMATVGFAWEVDRKFKSLLSTLFNSQTPGGPTMSQPNASPDRVDAIIYDLVRNYVRERACARAGVKTDDENWWTETADERRDVCAKLFLEFRSRHGDEFVGYFTDTIASVAQWLDEGRFLEVTRALMRHYSAEDGPDRPRTRDDVKTLTMLALAAHSRSLKTKAATADPGTTTSANAPENSQ
jgi:CRISPR-associated protein Cmx8